jgi:hypothetical protein
VDAKGASLAIIASPLYMLGLGPQLKTECIAIAKYLVTLLDKQPSTTISKFDVLGFSFTELPVHTDGTPLGFCGNENETTTKCSVTLSIESLLMSYTESTAV